MSSFFQPAVFFETPQPGAFVGDAGADVFEVAVGHYTSGTTRGGNADGRSTPFCWWIPRVPVFKSASVDFFLGRSVMSIVWMVAAR